MEYCQNPLFHNISKEEFTSMQLCLGAREYSYAAGETICTYGESFHSLGILASGTASVIRFEKNGSRTILEHLRKQDIFGDILAFQNPQYECILVVSSTPCQVMFIDYQNLLSTCSKICRCHQQLIQNMLALVSQKTLFLSERVEVLSKRTIREKLITYFNQLSIKNNSTQFELPFSQSDLADFLCIDRSAMGRELKKMRHEGLIAMNRRKVNVL